MTTLQKKDKLKLKYVIIPLLVVIILTVCCNIKDSSNQLGDDGIIENFFNQREIGELNILVNKFDSIIILKTKQSILLEEAYTKYFDRLTNVKSANEHIPMYSLNNLELQDIISHSTFNKIWSIKERYSQERELIGRYIDVELDNTYFKYLNSVSFENNIFEKYVNSISTSGTVLAPGQINAFFHNFQNVHFQEKRNRLIIAIQMITLNYYYSEYFSEHKIRTLNNWYVNTKQ